ncbi:hypothetical protein PNF31_09240 [Priestia megaterium]|uniref:hypothetical protein n=1 Tax=Priestia megaterium TaxID=1404 RepID=UPI00234EFB58|nr:hypothetical protein [Priestia megaterium]MDC7720987.1 hypothetical protein [Priestia megaterium]
MYVFGVSACLRGSCCSERPFISSSFKKQLQRLLFSIFIKLLARFLRIKSINKIVEKGEVFLSEEKKKTDYLGLGLSLGVAMGASLGMLMDNIGFGIAIGTSLGVAFGTAMN